MATQQEGCVTEHADHAPIWALQGMGLYPLPSKPKCIVRLNLQEAGRHAICALHHWCAQATAGFPIQLEGRIDCYFIIKCVMVISYKFLHFIHFAGFALWHTSNLFAGCGKGWGVTTDMFCRPTLWGRILHEFPSGTHTGFPDPE